MGLTLVDYDTWERKEFLEFFQQTTIYMTVQMDIVTLYKNLKQRNLRLYPALVYCAANVINRHTEFRYAYDFAYRPPNAEDVKGAEQFARSILDNCKFFDSTI